MKVQNKKDQNIMIKVFLVMVQLSKAHPKRHFSFRGKWFKNHNKNFAVASLCDTMYDRHSINFKSINEVFKLFLEAGVVVETDAFEYIQSEKNDYSNEYAVYVHVNCRKIRMFKFAEGISEEQIDMLDNQAMLYSNNDKPNRTLALQLGVWSIIGLLKEYLGGHGGNLASANDKPTPS